MNTSKYQYHMQIIDKNIKFNNTILFIWLHIYIY